MSVVTSPAAGAAARALHPLLGRRDPRFIARLHPLVARGVRLYYRAEVEGADNLPRDAALVVATHNGSLFTPDLYVLLSAFWDRFGPELPSFGLVHRVAFQVPYLGGLFARVGGLFACRQNAELVLRSGHPLLICPGGEVDALKTFRSRHRINMNGRRGFIRLALREQVPLVPVVSVGAHEVVFILHEGRGLARASGAATLMRLKVLPLALGFPFGLSPAGILGLPLPSKVRLRVLPPIRFAAPPSAADDPAEVERCVERVRAAMQRAIDELAAARRWPVLG